jgi:streptogramin lyase
VQGTTAWVACKEQSRVVRLSLPRGRRTATVSLDGPVIAVATGLGSVWALDSGSTLYRIGSKTARVTKRIQVGAAAAYNIWIGAGSVWVADDQGAAVLRVSPSGKVVRIAVGDGPADMVFRGARAWVLTHRDNTLYRIDTRTNTATRLGVVAGADAAAERLALLGDGLWVTGRGVGLLEADPETGAVRRPVDLDGTGIDVVAAAGALWIPVRTAAVDRTGFPTMTAVRRVTADGAVTTVATARGRVDVHGLAAAEGSVWLADNTAGFLYRLAT